MPIAGSLNYLADGLLMASNAAQRMGLTDLERKLHPMLRVTAGLLSQFETPSEPRH